MRHSRSPHTCVRPHASLSSTESGRPSDPRSSPQCLLVPAIDQRRLGGRETRSCIHRLSAAGRISADVIGMAMGVDEAGRGARRQGRVRIATATASAARGLRSRNRSARGRRGSSTARCWRRASRARRRAAGVEGAYSPRKSYHSAARSHQVGFARFDETHLLHAAPRHFNCFSRASARMNVVRFLQMHEPVNAVLGRKRRTLRAACAGGRAVRYHLVYANVQRSSIDLPGCRRNTVASDGSTIRFLPAVGMTPMDDVSPACVIPNAIR